MLDKLAFWVYYKERRKQRMIIGQYGFRQPLISQETFCSIERIMRENGIPVPEGRGWEKVEAIRRIVDIHNMPEDVRDRLKNLLATM